MKKMFVTLLLVSACLVGMRDSNSSAADNGTGGSTLEQLCESAWAMIITAQATLDSEMTKCSEVPTSECIMTVIDWMTFLDQVKAHYEDMKCDALLDFDLSGEDDLPSDVSPELEPEPVTFGNGWQTFDLVSPE